MRKLFWAVLLVSSLLVLVFARTAFAQDDSAANETLTNETNISGSGDVQKDLEVVLSRTRYIPNSAVDGVIKLKLSNPVDSSKLMTINFAGNSSKKTIAEILKLLNFSFTEAPPVISAVNPGSAKSVFVGTDSPAMFALKLPTGIDSITSVDMDISGVASNNLDIPYLDVGNDGNIDWYYLGDKKSWRQEYIGSVDLKEEGSRTVILYDNKQNKSTYYCSWIDVPRTKDLRIFAKYSKLAQGGNIKAAVLTSTVPNDPLEVAGLGTICDLPEPEQDVMQYAGCDVHLDYAAKGKLHVCVFAEVPAKSDTLELYSLSVDALEPLTATSFNCEPNADWGICLPHETGDYFIKVQIANYNSNLNKTIDFSGWNTYPNSFAAAIERYVGTSGEDGEPLDGVCKGAVCTVPVTVYGNGTGYLVFSSLNLKYKSQGSTTVESTFYEVQRATTEIDSINGKSLSTTPVTLEIPLSVFGEFRTAMPNFVFADQKLEVKFNQDAAEVILRVYRDKIPESATQKVVDDTSQVIANALGNSDILKLLKVLQLDEKFSDAKNKLDEYSVELAEKGDDPDLVAEVESYVADLPSSIRLKKSLVDKFVAEPSDMSSDVKSALSSDELYAFQFNADILAQLKMYEISYNSGEKTSALMVVKKLNPQESLKKITVFEVIPKSVAQSVDSVKFEQTPKVVNPDPVVSWYFPDFIPTEISYVVETDAEPNIYDFKTLIAPTEGVKEEVVEPICGDGVCDAEEDAEVCPDDCKVEAGFNWPVFVGGGLAALLMILYIVAFFNPNSFRKAALGGMPFKSAGNLNSVVAYISGAKSKGVPDSKIFAALKQSKWSEKQIKFAYSAMAMDRQLDAQLKSLPQKQKGTGPMKKYLAAALSRGIDVKTATAYLLKAGWSEGEIGGAYFAARLGIPIKLALSKIGIKVK